MSILARIRAHGGDLIRDGYKFRLRKGRLTPDNLKWITEHIDQAKREIWPLYDEWEERAAIMEYDGGFSRESAERAAYVCVGGQLADAA